MASPEPGPAFGTGAGSRIFRVGCAGRVKIAIIFLRCGDQIDQAVGVLLQLWIRMNMKGIGYSFDYLVNVCVIEPAARVFAFF
jgi:hypothetical protein